MKLTDLPAFHSLLTKKAKLVRHQGPNGIVDRLKAHGQVEVYQEFQSKPIFHGCELIISFTGEHRSASRFLGVYSVKSSIGPDLHKPIKGYLDQAMFHDGQRRYRYSLEKLKGFEDLEGRLVIDWGKSTRSWHQWLNKTEKEVLEISPKGYLKPFPGYEDFILTYRELQQLTMNPSANREWHDLLRATAGVYLILDTRDGKQYVGSATGEGGIWNRWCEYVKNGHGGNKQLIELTKTPDAAQHFEFSILRTLPRSMARKTVLAHEALYKNKLGSRAFGLNSN